MTAREKLTLVELCAVISAMAATVVLTLQGAMSGDAATGVIGGALGFAFGRTGGA